MINLCRGIAGWDSFSHCNGYLKHCWCKKQIIDWSTSSWLHCGVKMYLRWLITSLLNYCFSAVMDSALRCRSLALVPEAWWNLFLNKSSSCLTALACEVASFSTRRCGATDRDLSLLAAGINVIMRTKYKSSTETKQVKMASARLWMESDAELALPSSALRKQQPPVHFFFPFFSSPWQMQTACQTALN